MYVIVLLPITSQEIAMQKKILPVVISFIVAGCGGGEPEVSKISTSVSQAILPLTAQIQPDVDLFSNGITKFPDLRPYMDSMCGTQTNIQSFFLADLNKDGRKDVVMSLWCRSETGVLSYGPTKNKVIVFEQQVDGTFIDSTKKIFGKDFIDLNGVGHNYVVYDFNKDGYDDFVFVVSKEDARLPSPDGATNHHAYNTFFTSKGDGTYEIAPMGIFAWNYGIKLIDNPTGGKDIITIPIGYTKLVEHFSFVNGKWVISSQYNWINGTDPIIFSGKEAKHAVTSAPYPDLGVAYYNKSSNGSWVLADSEKFGEYKMVPFVTWQLMKKDIQLYSIDGKQYTIMATANMCELKSPTESVAIVAVSGQEFITPYVEGTTIEEGAPYLKMFSKLLSYKITTKLEKNSNFSIKGEITASLYKMNCVDVNNDGYDDITVHDWRVKTEPIIYVNNKNGTMSRVDPSKIPGKNLFASSQTYIYEDVNNDGIRDIIYWPIAGFGSDDNLALKVYYGNRQIKDSDLIQN